MNLEQKFEDYMVKFVAKNGEMSEGTKALLMEAYVGGYSDALKTPAKLDVDELSAMNMSQLASLLKNARLDVDFFGSLKTEYQKIHDQLAFGILPDRMEEEDIETLKIKDVGRLQLSTDLRCSVLANNRDALKDWLIKNGHGSMVAETINSSTLKAFVKERMKENKEWPENLIKAEAFSRASVVKG